MYEPIPGYHGEPGLMPATWAAAGRGIPSVCARHGEPALSRFTLKLQAPPPGWAYLLGPAFPIYIILTADSVKTVTVPRWPFCGRCLSMRFWRCLAAWTLVPVMIAVCGVGALPPKWLALVVLAVEIAIFQAMRLTFWLGSYPKIARVTLSQDGKWIETKNPAPQFQAELDQARANYSGQ